LTILNYFWVILTEVHLGKTPDSVSNYASNTFQFQIKFLEINTVETNTCP